MNALATIAPALRCPVCQASMAVEPQTVRCQHGHSFDIARQGQLNLLGRAAPRNADTAAMIAARQRFLDSGKYAIIGDAITELAPDQGLLLDCGAGPGWYSALALKHRPALHAVALDVSPLAARAAARAHARLAAVVADIWQPLPIHDAMIETVLCIFAPRNPAEFARVLRPGGRLIVATPGPDHLVELRMRDGLIGIDPQKDRRLEDSLTRGFGITDHRVLRQQLSLTEQQVADLLNMGPNAFHRPTTAAEPAEVTLDIRIRCARSR